MRMYILGFICALDSDAATTLVYPQMELNLSFQNSNNEYEEKASPFFRVIQTISTPFNCAIVCAARCLNKVEDASKEMMSLKYHPELFQA